MINDRNIIFNYSLNEPNHYNNKYFSSAGRNKHQIPKNLYYFDLINTTNKTEPNFDYYIKINNHEKGRNSNHLYNQKQKIIFRNNNSNMVKNNFRNYSNNCTLSKISLNKYRRLLENNNLETENNYFNKTHKTQNYSNDERRVSIIEKNPESYNQKNQINNNYFIDNSDKIDDRKKLNREINNFNFLVKKINKSIERSKMHRMRLNNDIENNDIINYNDFDDERENLVSEFTINENKLKNKKLKNIKNLKEENNKKNYKFNSINTDSEEKINHNFIRYLKNSNLKLLSLNSIYKEIIDNFFYFINQLSKKILFKEEIRDVNYYISNTKSLSNLLINLQEYLNKLIKFERENNNEGIKKCEKESPEESKLIKINKNICINYKNNIPRKHKTRNNFNFNEYLSQTNTNFNTKRNFIYKTQQFNSKDENITEEIENIQNIKQNKINMVRHNEKIIKVMNKLNLENFTPKNKNINNKIIVNKNIAMNNSHKKFQQNLKFKSSNDLKSLLKQKFIKEKK